MAEDSPRPAPSPRPLQHPPRFTLQPLPSLSLPVLQGDTIAKPLSSKLPSQVTHPQGELSPFPPPPHPRRQASSVSRPHALRGRPSHPWQTPAPLSTPLPQSRVEPRPTCHPHPHLTLWARALLRPPPRLTCGWTPVRGSGCLHDPRSQAAHPGAGSRVGFRGRRHLPRASP